MPYSRNLDFIGRSGILEKLKTQLTYGEPQKGGKVHLRAALYGLGGIG